MAVTLDRRTAAASSVPSTGVDRPRNPSLMEKFVIQGGVPLSGTIVPAGNKNGALPILASALLTDDEVVIRNVPRIADVEAMIDLLRQLGARADWIGENEVAIRADGISST